MYIDIYVMYMFFNLYAFIYIILTHVGRNNTFLQVGNEPLTYTGHIGASPQLYLYLQGI